MWLSNQSYAAIWRSMLQGVIQKICNALLNFLIIEFENGQLRMDFNVQTNFSPAERVVPSASNIRDAVPQIIVAQLQDKFPTFQRRVVQEHRNQTDQAITTFFRL